MNNRKSPSRHALRIVAGIALAAAPIIVLGYAAPEAVSPKRDRLPAPAGMVDTETTGSIPVRVAGVLDPEHVRTASVGPLRDGLDALEAGDTFRARSVRDSLPDSSLDQHILTWAIALKGGKDVSSGEIAAAARTLKGWPGATAFRRNSERAMWREQPAAQVVIDAFAGSTPETASGAIILARSFVTLGDAEKARAVLSPLWRTEKLDASEEAAIIREFATIIPVADHRERMERMLYAERVASANRVAALAGAGELAKAWIAVIRNEKAAGKLLAAVPAAQRSAGYAFAETRMLRRGGKFTEAAAAMLKAPVDAKSLVDPDAWWIERRALARELVDAGDTKAAYRIVAAHAAESPIHAADAEFHAGWYALRHLNDATNAAKHFARIAEVAEGPISLSRAYYWMGRTAEAGGPGDAKALFAKAAEFGTCFYGQLAAARIGQSAINIDSPVASTNDRLNFSRREAVQAIRRLETAGYADRADILYRDLAAQLTSPGEFTLLAGMAESRGNHFLALRIAKSAVARGIDVGALSHPVGAIPATADISGAGKALAYAIARQESEFNVGAVSRAGALGLLQLMPKTAQDLARKAGVSYEPSRLTSDAGYNASLGAAFLGEQLGRFDGSYVLTFAGYNAGPRRATDWMKRYGDPRGKSVDEVVDWIENIPFSETRSYVQRVMENYQVYKMRLSGKTDIALDLTGGSGR